MSSLTIVSTLMVASAAVTLHSTPARIYPVQAPQKLAEAPYYVLNLVGGTDQQLLGGAGKYYQGRVRIECLALSGTVAVLMGNAVMATLEDIVKQTIGDFTDVDVWFANLDTTDPDNIREDLCRRILDFYVQYR